MTQPIHAPLQMSIRTAGAALPILPQAAQQAAAPITCQAPAGGPARG